MREFSVGQKAEMSKTVSESDVYLFAGLCGDFNALHIDAVKASESRFGGRIVHGALINAFVSAVLGMKLPGDGTIYLPQKSKFIKPVYIGDTITARVEIIAIENNKAELRTQVINQNEIIVLDGEAKVILPLMDNK